VQRGGWIRWDARAQLRSGESLSLDWSTYRRPEKIVFRQTADRIIATVDRSCMAMGRSVIAITSAADASLFALLACLNSHLLMALYRALAGEEGRVLPQVKVGKVLSLPVPSASAVGVTPCQTSADQAVRSWLELERLGRQLLAAEGKDAGLDDLVEKTVCRLYGVTAEDQALIGLATV
jgi:hypothetical protein